MELTQANAVAKLTRLFTHATFALMLPAGHQRMPPRASRLTSVQRRGANTSQHIFFERDGLQVVGVNAMTDAAQVIQVESVRDGANAKLVGPAMDGNHPLLFPAPDVPVLANGVEAPCPKPAFIGKRDPRPESPWRILAGLYRNLCRIALMAMPSRVMPFAETAPNSGLGTIGNATLRLHLKLILSGATPSEPNTSRGLLLTH